MSTNTLSRNGYVLTRSIFGVRRFIRRYALLEQLLPIGVFTLGLVAIFIANYLMAATDSAFLIAGGVIGAFLALWIVLRPQVGLYILAIFTYLNLSDALEVNFGIPKINQPLIALILVSVLANRIVLRRKPLVFRGVEATMVFYGVVATMSVLFAAANQSAALDRLIDWLKDFAILIIMVQLCDDEQSFRTVLWALILSAALVAGLSWYHTFTGDTQNTFFGLAKSGVHQIVGDLDDVRVTGPLDDPNFYAQILLMIFPLAAYRMLTGTTQAGRLLGALCTVLIVGAAIFTYSRGGFLALVVVTVLLVLDRKYNLLRVALVGAIMVAILIPILPSGYVSRVMTLSDAVASDPTMQTEASFRGRTSEMLIALQMFAENPILGVGKRNYQALYIEYSSVLGLDPRLESRQAHSLYLELMAEMGTLGILAFSSILAALFWSTARARRQFRALGRPDLAAWTASLQLGIVSYLTTSIFLHADYARYMWIMFALAASASVLSQAMTERRNAAQRESSQATLPASDLARFEEKDS
ncbi:MAG: O-antigen ligase family protein [Anaerolineae bacterium]|nr:O-antigen ligase family protein [Anaerolineae bacterium]